jgi:hypothetical protein
MMQGLSPQQIIDSVVANDAQNNAKTRQYGIVDYNNGHPRSASYTGINCQNYKNDTNNIYYSIQGNILLGQLVIDSMQNRFLKASGSLSDRLMAALQGAKMIGADTRCAVHNSSSLSSFLRVARPGDPYDTLYCDLYMAYPQTFSGICPVDPIDSLQTLYDLWKTTTSVKNNKQGIPLKVWSTGSGEVTFDFTRCPDHIAGMIIMYDITGRIITRVPVTNHKEIVHLPSGPAERICFYQVMNLDQVMIARGKIFLKE